MARISRNRRRAALMKARRSRNYMWYALSGVIIIAGVSLIMVSKSPAQSPKIGEHWHSAFGVNVCGEWLADGPEFHNDAENANVQAGLHSHGDGLLHFHPFVSAEAGKKATVGKYLKYAGYEASQDSFTMWDGVEHKNGDDPGCNGEPAEVRWSVNGEEQSGNISSYRAKDGDVIALAYLPPGEEIGEPPSAANLAAPSDLTTPGQTAIITPDSVVPTDSVPTDSVPTDSVPTDSSVPASDVPTTDAPTTDAPATSTP